MAVRFRKSGGSPEHRPPPAVVISGSRLRNRYFIILLGRPLGLTYTLFNVFIELLHARRNPHSNGYAPARDEGVTRVTIHRTRKAIAGLFGWEFARELIQTGGKSEYRLDPRVRDADIVLDASVPELVALSVLSAEELADLQSRYRTLPHRWPMEGTTVPAAEATAARQTQPPSRGIVRLARPRALTTTATHLAALA